MPCVLTDWGDAIELNNGDRITDIAGESRDLYLIEVAPHAQGSSCFGLVWPTCVRLTPYLQFNETTMKPEYDAEHCLQGQVKTEKFKRRDPKRGPDDPESYEVIYFRNGDASKDYSLIRCIAVDGSSGGLMISGLYQVAYVTTTTTGGDPDLMIPGTTTDSTPVVLSPTRVEIQEQFEFSESIRIKRGDAMFRVSRDQVSLDTLQQDNLYFLITPRGSTTPIRYQLWNADGGQGEYKGVEQEQPYFWTVYLKRVRS